MAHLGPGERSIITFPTQLVKCLHKPPPLHSVTFLTKTGQHKSMDINMNISKAHFKYKKTWPFSNRNMCPIRTCHLCSHRFLDKFIIKDSGSSLRSRPQVQLEVIGYTHNCYATITSVDRACLTSHCGFVGVTAGWEFWWHFPLHSAFPHCENQPVQLTLSVLFQVDFSMSTKLCDVFSKQILA